MADRGGGQGTTDLNGDGDTNDSVLALYDAPTGQAKNLGLAVRAQQGDLLADFVDFDGSHLAAAVDETGQGADLNGDGDTADMVLHVVDASTGATTNVGLSAFEIHVDGGYVAFRVSEAAQGAEDLNGDADIDDWIVHVHDITSGATTNLTLSGTTRAPGFDGRMRPIQDGALVVFVFEAGQGEDLNGDGDAADIVPQVRDLATGTTMNVGVAAIPPLFAAFDGQQLAFHGPDVKLQVYDVGNRTTTDVGQTGLSPMEVADGRVAFLVGEQAAGEDMNGDGDTVDAVLHVYDAATGDTAHVGLSTHGFEVSLVGRNAVFLVSEAAQGNTDLNGDGDALDGLVPHVYDTVTRTTTNLGLALGSTFDIHADGLHVAFATPEWLQGDRDLNGDADALDYVLHLYSMDAPQSPPAPPPAPPAAGGGGGGGGGPDLLLTKAADRATAGIGDVLTFRLDVTLANPQATSGASRLVLTDPLPTNVELVSVTTNRGACSGTRTVVCDLDFLSGTLVATVHVVVRVTGEGEIVNTASVKADEGDPAPANNTATSRVSPPAAAAPPPRTTTTARGVVRVGSAPGETLRGTSRGDVLRGLGGNDLLIGLAGGDVLEGGPGLDRFDAGAGNDWVRARDRARDRIRCGPGRDLVMADRVDVVARDCEIVRRR